MVLIVTWVFKSITFQPYFVNIFSTLTHLKMSMNWISFSLNSIVHGYGYFIQMMFILTNPTNLKSDLS